MKTIMAVLGFLVLLAMVASVHMATQRPGDLSVKPIMPKPDLSEAQPAPVVGGIVVVILGVVALVGGFSLRTGATLKGTVAGIITLAVLFALAAVYVALTEGVSW